jgi:integrase
VTGKKLPLRDDNGDKIHGADNEAKAKEAYHRESLMLLREPDKKTTTTGDVAKAFIIHAKSHCCAERYKYLKQSLENFLTHVGPNKPAMQVTRKNLQDWITELEKTKKRNTISLAVASVKAAFNYAYNDERIIPENPLRGFPTVSTTAKSEVYTESQIAQIFQKAEPEFNLLVQFIYETGCRPGEAYKLTAAHFQDDADHGEIILEPSEHKNGRKTGKPRTIFLSRKATQLIRDLAKRHPTGRLFRPKTGKQWHSANTSRYLRRLRKTIGFSDQLTMHSLRHTFATRHIDAGVPIERVAMWLGDTVQTVQKTYWHALHKANKNLYTGLDG